MLKFDDWRVEYRPGGWVRARNSTGVTVYLQVLPVGEGEATRLRAHMALMTSLDPITPTMWRNVPYSEIEMHISLMGRITDEREHFEAMLRTIEVDCASADGLDLYFDQTPAIPIGGTIPTSVVVDDQGRALFTPVRPPQGRITREFLDNVADMYRWAVLEGKAPAPLIAESAGVPVRTVHRWIAEARKHGALPPGVRGRAG